jgi:hypothetical protein
VKESGIIVLTALALLVGFALTRAQDKAVRVAGGLVVLAGLIVLSGFGYEWGFAVAVLFALIVLFGLLPSVRR